MTEMFKMTKKTTFFFVIEKSSQAHLKFTKTCPCNIQRFFFHLQKLQISSENVDISYIFAQNIDRGYTCEPLRRGVSKEYPQSMFWSKNKKNRFTPAYPSFPIKVGFK